MLITYCRARARRCGGGGGGGVGATGIVLVHGGRAVSGDTLGDVWSFSPADAAWELLYSPPPASASAATKTLNVAAAHPPALHSHSGVARGGSLYVFGGARGVDGAVSDATWRFTLATKTWSELTAAQAATLRPSARLGAAAATGGGGGGWGGFYVVGGVDEEGARMADAWRSDTETERWELVAPDPSKSKGGEAGAGGAGGSSGGGPLPHSRGAAAVTPGVLFLFGGEGDKANHDVLWRLPTF